MHCVYVQAQKALSQVKMSWKTPVLSQKRNRKVSLASGYQAFLGN